MNPLKQLAEAGQAPWLDFVHRQFIESGELRTLIERDGLRGVTSNPAIFQKGISGSPEYGKAIEVLLKQGDQAPMAIYEHLAIADIQNAADVLRPVFDETKGADGFVSLEVSPYLAFDTDATINEARRLAKAVNRPNLMVKVPGTDEGIPAIRTLIGEGLSINVTLLFAVPVYERVAEAFIAGLEDFAAKGGDVSKVASVASFFVSRIDAMVDGQIQSKIKAGGDEKTLKPLLGRTAIANAKMAYASYQRIFAGDRWQKLADKGARTQRVLWASTSTKNPDFRDTLYVETLIGKDTVNTMPPATMDAFRDHGEVTKDAVTSDLDDAHRTLEAIAREGISLETVTADLVADGVQQFAAAFDALLGAVAERRSRLISQNKMDFDAPDALRHDLATMEKAWTTDGRIRKLWRHDRTVWSGADEDKWLGWLDIVARERAAVEELEDFAKQVKARGFSHVLLLGMGGSSLGPEVIATTYGRQAGWPQFHMIDATDPAQISSTEAALDLGKTLVIVSSKSGSTLEPNILYAHFRERVKATLGDDWARSFVAVTDPGSALEKEATARGFWHVFHGDPKIGGRYSVLSRFGLVPAAAMGVDLRQFLDTTAVMMRSCGGDVPVADNPGADLGLFLGLAARRFGRDKITFGASPQLADLGAWMEQLIAESTGKHGKALIPVDGETLAGPEAYGHDRVFVHFILEGDDVSEYSRALDELVKAGHPVIRIVVRDVAHLGQEFYRWEMATAVAGAVIGINPFDQPDVEAAKVKARELTDAYEKTGRLDQPEPIFRANGVSLYADSANAEALGRHNTLSAYLAKHFERAHAGDYIALLAYLERDAANTKALQAIRMKLRDARRTATCLGFGPRFQHSTGQAYKGGPNTGVFLQITCDDAQDLDVPGAKYSFGVVKAAQAQGDLAVLNERDRRALRVHVKEVESGLKELSAAVEQALA